MPKSRNLMNWIAIATLAMGAQMATTAPGLAKSKPTVCPIGTFYTPISRTCVSVATQHGNLTKASVFTVKKSRIRQLRTKKPRFDAIGMNGVRAKRTDIVAPNN